MPPLKPEECASPVVRALVEAYCNSRHGRTGAGRRRFSVRYEKLVDKLAQVTFKEEKQGRLLLERLRACGLIQWDHVPLQRDQIKTIYIAPASENAFFAAVNEAPPGNQRSAAAGTLAKHLDALRGHRYESAWRSALQHAMDDLNNGRSAEGLPNDTKLHDIIISATAAVLNNQKTTLIRRLGSEKLKDSKLLRRRQDTIERFMTEFLPPDLAMLEAWNIARTPLLVLLRGPLGIEMDVRPAVRRGHLLCPAHGLSVERPQRHRALSKFHRA